MKLNLLLSSILLFATACATMSQEDCQKANWKMIGEEAGREGKPTTSFTRISRQCQEFGISVSQAEWVSGYKIGLSAFCTFENGYEIGLKGETYQKVCPSNSSKEFLRGYIEGKRSFDQQKLRNEQRQQYAEEQQRQNQFRERILGNMRNQSCQSEYDCVIKDSCNKNKCSYTGKQCSVDYNCEIKGSCYSNKCQF
ncbi:MAG: hypothetical protein COW00_06965 [Bdellovibrio sp. CG12_big_fil_rev_8_21_14_0_65_39_13]|nr:MAG: hypothetical protein COW78_03090 [Bdellovibrio sp. CG22_combo_CG10-13_8_21_14_all_39_27]PIQ60344.1 MAG: hypothetical protein COW00_06965 [Bdellovibrio sp. CG12_big_fil_rev_8_21_14_0_65_39_13]PIR35046.1 MAG: hypothetical protein COV37_10495 [Bdellovibrio sp. CG11_big_fil_rev_8_21_14_0_20_39_38]